MSRAPAWTPAEIATFHRLYPSGGPKAVAAATGRPYGSVKVRAHRLGIKTSVIKGHVAPKFDPVVVAEILERNDWSPSRTARLIGCSTYTVRKARLLADARRKAGIRARRAERSATITNHLEGFLA